MKKKCYHLGTVQTINIAVKKKANLIRRTFTADLLKEGISNGKDKTKQETKEE
jgi:hypothetical protein